MTLLGVAVFAGAGTIHYQTPLLGTFGQAFQADAGAVGWVATLTFGGFLAGMVFLVPLGDRVDKRTLILSQLAGAIISMLGMAAAPSLAWLAALSFITGMCACFAQNIIPLVAELASSEERGRSVAAVLTALFLGILFARVGSGLVASVLGWRWVYVLAAAMLLALAPALVARLPHTRPTTRLPYPALMASLFHRLRSNRELRHASSIQFLIGISYGGFWATVAPMLLMFHGLGPTQAGLMAIPGAAGVLVTRRAGRWMDRRGTFPVVTTGVALVLGAYLAFAFAPVAISAVVAGAILLDCGLRSAMVANQTLVNSVVPDARSRFNTVFGSHVWGGNAAGAFLASTALAHLGWLAVCAIAASASFLALGLQWRARMRPA